MAFRFTVKMYNTPSPPCCPTSEVYIHSSGIPSALKRLYHKYIIYSFAIGGKEKKSRLPSLNPSDARQMSLSVWEKAVMKKALNAILFIAAAWALNTGTHSFEEAEGGGTLAKWIQLCEPLNTNSSFKKHRKLPETTINRRFSVMDPLDAISQHSESVSWSERQATFILPRCWRRRSARLPATARLTRC